MRKAKEEAERSNEAKSVFLAKMNHQLRTPLNAVIGYSEILLEDAEARCEESQMRDLERINSAGRHLLALVTDVLDVGKITSKDVELVVRPVDLAGLVDDVVSTCGSLVTINRNEFVVDKGDDLGTVFTDETRLRQIVFNLLSNAGKFTSRGVVTLGVSRAADTFVISVKDTGIGISRDNIEKLFTDFSQAEASTSTKYGGTGLGLALCRNLCHLMGGEISVESELGRGSTFAVRLPVEAGPQPAAAAAPMAAPQPAAAAAPMPSPFEETEALGA